MIKTYFQENCFLSVQKYIANIKTLIEKVGELNEDKSSRYMIIINFT